MQQVYIYILIDPNTNYVRYVGKSINPERRLKDHIYNKKKTHCSYWIQSLGKDKQEPILIIIDCINGNWEFWEQHYISLYKSWGFKLCNHTNGGEGNHGVKLSEETKKKMSLIHKGKQYAKGSVRTQDFKDNLSIKFKGNTNAKGSIRDVSFRKKLSENNGRGNAKLTEEEVIKVCELINQGLKGRAIKKIVPSIESHILWNIKNGKSWKHITSKYLNDGKSIS